LFLTATFALSRVTQMNELVRNATLVDIQPMRLTRSMCLSHTRYSDSDSGLLNDSVTLVFNSQLCLNILLLHDLLSCSYLQHCVWSVITGHNSPQTVCGELRTNEQRATSLSLAGAATPTVECKQLMGRSTIASQMRHTHTVDDL